MRSYNEWTLMIKWHFSLLTSIHKQDTLENANLNFVTIDHRGERRKLSPLWFDEFGRTTLLVIKSRCMMLQ